MISGDIRVTANYKLGTNGELWPQEFSGIESVTLQHNAGGPRRETIYADDLENPANMKFYGFTSGTGLTAFVKVKEGYDKNNIALKITNGGEQVDTDTKLIACEGTETQYGDYKFKISTRLRFNIGISVIAQPIASKFQVVYKYADENDTTVTDPTEYDLNIKNIVQFPETPVRQGYKFTGWEMNGVTYKPGTAVYKIDGKTISSAKLDGDTYVCTFTAQWEEAETIDETKYTVKMYFQNENGSYAENANVPAIEEYTKSTGRVYVSYGSVKTYIDDILGEGWDEEYEVDTAKSIPYADLSSSDPTVEIYYKHKLYSYTINYTGLDQDDAIDSFTSQVIYKVNDEIRVAPKDVAGYYVESVSVTDKNGATVPYTKDTDKKFGTIITAMCSGGLTITYTYAKQIELPVTAKSLNETYDGTEQKVSGFVTGEGVTESVNPETGAITLTVTVDGTEYVITGLSAGETRTNAVANVKIPVEGIASATVMSNGEDVTRKCKIVATDGTFTINKRSVTVYAEASKEFNGETQEFDLTASGVTYKYSGDGLLTGDTLTLLNATIKGQNAGAYTDFEETPTWEVTNRAGDVTGNYEVTVTGKLEITKASGNFDRSVEIEGWTYGDTLEPSNTPTATIDCSDYEEPTFTYKKAEASDDAFTADVPTDAGEYVVRANWAETENYKAVHADKDFTIAKREVTLYAEKTLTYNGLEQTFDISTGDVNIVSGSWAYSDKLESLSGASISGKDANKDNEGYTDVKTDELTVVIKNGEKNVTDNYAVTVTGKLVIKKAPAKDSTGTVRISGWTYNGTSKMPEVKVEGVGANDYGTPEFVYEERKNWSIEWKEISEAPIEVGNYRVKAVWAATDNCEALESDVAKFEITKRKITITAKSDQKSFDGTPLVNSGYDVTGDGVAPGQTLEVVVKGSQTNVNKLSLINNNEVKSVKITQDGQTIDIKRNYDVDTKPGLLRVTDEDVEDKNIINKTHTPKADGYNVGDEVVFTISVTNMYNNDGELIKIKEIGDVNTDLNLWEQWAGDSFKAGETKNITARYTIKEQDILNGEFVNTATAKYSVARGIDKVYQATDTVEVAQPTATLDVTMVPEKTSGYDLNEQVTYTVTVTNTGNLTLAPGTVVTVDKGTVVDGTTGAGYTITEALAPNASATFEVTYDVTEADIRAGKIVNNATAEGTIAQYNELVQTVYPTNRVIGVSTDAIVTTAEVKPQIVLTKDIVSITDANGNGKPKDGPVNIGDVITYEITAKNTGNIALKNVVIEDALTGNTVANGTALQSIQYGFGPGAELRLLDDTVTYTVTEADIVAGKVINRATVVEDGITDLDGNPVPSEDIVVEDGVKEIGTQQQEPSLGMIIERAPVNPDDPDSAPDNSIVGLNDEVNYIIRVTNNGNVTIENIKVTDVLTGNVEDEELEIASLAPGESAELPVTYSPVTEDDILAGSIVNQASAVGTNANKETETVTVNAEHTATTAAVSTAYTVTRTLTDPQDLYRVGETIRYTITITSQANVSLNNVVVSDLLDGAAGNVTFTGMTTTAADGTEDQADTVPVNAANEVVIDRLQPGSTVTLTCEYTVVRADAGTDKTIIGTTNVKADSVWTTGENVVENKVAEMTSTADLAPVENIYNLTIHYVYAQGGQAAPDVTAQYLEGETFTYTTPAIDGYTPDFGTVGSGANGMLARDVEVTVVYMAVPAAVPTTPGTPGTPGTPYTPGTPIIMGEPQVTPVVADAAAAAVPAAATVTTVAAAAPEGEDPVDIEDNEVPLVQPEDGQITEDENGDVDLVPIEDEEVPLANTVIDEHVFCILHYLLLLLTVILSICYAISLKKQQKRLVILQKGYDEEMRNH